MTGQRKNNNDISINQSSGKNKHSSWNKGLKGYLAGAKHYLWTGENGSYNIKHKWMTYHYGKPSFCEGCGTEEAKYYEWANISGEYKRDREDWLRLCKKCHHKYDKAILDQNRGINKNNQSGYKGVSWHKITNTWRASIMKNHKQYHLGLFKKREEAALAYNEAAIKIYGKKAWQNIIK